MVWTYFLIYAHFLFIVIYLFNTLINTCSLKMVLLNKKINNNNWLCFVPKKSYFPCNYTTHFLKNNMSYSPCRCWQFLYLGKNNKTTIGDYLQIFIKKYSIRYKVYNVRTNGIVLGHAYGKSLYIYCMNNHDV